MRWVKMRVGLTEEVEVGHICRLTGLDPFQVVGRLHAVWAWADFHTTNGVANGIGADWIDGIVKHPGFAVAMAEAGWLEVSDEGIRIPKFRKHNGETAKARANSASRSSKYRRRKKPQMREQDATHDGDFTCDDFSARDGGVTNCAPTGPEPDRTGTGHKNPGSGSGAALQRIEAGSLRSNAALCDLCESLGLTSEQDRIRVFSVAERCLRIGKRPGGMFRRILEKRLWKVIASEDEDAGRRRIRGIGSTGPPNGHHEALRASIPRSE